MTFPRSKSLQVELRKVEGFWSELQLLQQTLSKYLNVEQQAHWMLMWKETNHLWSIMMWLYHTELESASAIIIKTFIPADINFMIEGSKSTHFYILHLADAFIQSDLQCIQAIHFLSVCVFPGNWTHNLCAANAMLYHWATGTLHTEYTLLSVLCARTLYIQIKSLLLSHHHSTCALVSEILESMLQTVQKQFTYTQYILTQYAAANFNCDLNIWELFRAIFLYHCFLPRHSYNYLNILEW